MENKIMQLLIVRIMVAVSDLDALFNFSDDTI